MSQSPLAFVALNGKAGKGVSPGAVGQQGELFVGQRHGANYEAAYAATIGLVANSAAVTTSAALATTYVGLCLSNPVASGKNLVLLNVSGAFLVAPATITTAFLAVGYSAAGITAHTTPLTPLNGLLGTTTTPALVGLADSACTLVGTPAYAKVLAQTPTATTSFSFSYDANGALVIPPGGWAAIATNIASPASGFVGSMLWEEVAQ